MPPSWTQTIDTMFTSTWAYRRPSVTEQAYLKTPLIYWLKESGRVDHVSGHRRIEIPVEYGSNETVRWITKGDRVPMQDSELITMAYEEWKTVAVSIIRWLSDDQKNRGKASAINMVTTKLNAAERSLWEEFERVAWSDGTGSNEPNGLLNLIATTPTSGTVHGLDRATYTWWQNQTKAASGAAAVYLISDMRTCLNDITKYSRSEVKNLFMFTDQTVFELYEDIALELKTLQNAKVADMSFDTIEFRGRPIMWAPSAEAGVMRFINPNYLKLVIDNDYWLEMTSWKEVPDQPFDKVAQIVATMNLVGSRFICQKCLTGVAA